ncbi:MAG: ATP-binding cassette domain-containing protein [Armatimonadetes bacterium]|nr:ATP-binding cassette domain-containing protein [Armatimonadota bacterium]
MCPIVAPPGILLRSAGAAYGRRTVLHGIDLSLEPGACLRVFGHAGAGKSALLALLAGALPPSSGEISVRGGDPRPDALHVGLAGTHPDLPRRGTPRTLLASRLGDAGAPRTAHTALATRALEACSLFEFRDEPVSDLSGSRRVALGIAMALAPAPPLLLLDDCLAPLDAHVRRRLVDYLVEARSSDRVTVVHATNRADAEDGAERALVLEKGHQVAFGPMEELTRSEPCDEVVIDALDPRAAGLTLHGMFDVEAFEEPGRLTLRCRDGVEMAGQVLRRPPDGLRVVTVRRRTLADLLSQGHTPQGGR